MADQMGRLLIMTKRKGYCVALTDDGAFVKVRCSKEVRVGDVVSAGNVIWLPSSTRNRALRKLAATAAILVMAVGLASWLFLWPVEAALIAVDINPSMELHLDTHGKVMRTVALNSDAAQLLAGLSLNEQQYSEALSTIIDKAVAEGYLTSTDENLVALSVVTNNSLLTRLRKTPAVQQEQVRELVAESLTDKQVEAWLLVQSASREQYQYAAKKGTSLNKVLIAEKGQELGIDLEELDKKGIMEVLKEMQIPPGKVLGNGAQFYKVQPKHGAPEPKIPGKAPSSEPGVDDKQEPPETKKLTPGAPEPKIPGKAPSSKPGVDDKQEPPGTKKLTPDKAGTEDRPGRGNSRKPVQQGKSVEEGK